LRDSKNPILTRVLLAGETGIPSAGVTIFGTLGASVDCAEGVGPTAVTSSVVEGVWEAIIRAVGSHAVCELELVGRTSAVGFAIVVFLLSPDVDVGARVAESVILESVGLLDRLV
jgi:hypothetical protein